MAPKRKTLEDKCIYKVDDDMVTPWTPPTTEQGTLKSLKELTTEDTKALLRFFNVEHDPKDKKDFLTQELRNYFINKGFKQTEHNLEEAQNPNITTINGIRHFLNTEGKLYKLSKNYLTIIEVDLQWTAKELKEQWRRKVLTTTQWETRNITFLNENGLEIAGDKTTLAQFGIKRNAKVKWYMTDKEPAELDKQEEVIIRFNWEAKGLKESIKVASTDKITAVKHKIASFCNDLKISCTTNNMRLSTATVGRLCNNKRVKDYNMKEVNIIMLYHEEDKDEADDFLESEQEQEEPKAKAKAKSKLSKKHDSDSDDYPEDKPKPKPVETARYDPKENKQWQNTLVKLAKQPELINHVKMNIQRDIDELEKKIKGTKNKDERAGWGEQKKEHEANMEDLENFIRKMKAKKQATDKELTDTCAAAATSEFNVTIKFPERKKKYIMNFQEPTTVFRIKSRLVLVWKVPIENQAIFLNKEATDDELDNDFTISKDTVLFLYEAEEEEEEEEEGKEEDKEEEPEEEDKEGDFQPNEHFHKTVATAKAIYKKMGIFMDADMP